MLKGVLRFFRRRKVIKKAKNRGKDVWKYRFVALCRKSGCEFLLRLKSDKEKINAIRRLAGKKLDGKVKMEILKAMLQFERGDVRKEIYKAIGSLEKGHVILTKRFKKEDYKTRICIAEVLSRFTNKRVGNFLLKVLVNDISEFVREAAGKSLRKIAFELGAKVKLGNISRMLKRAGYAQRSIILYLFAIGKLNVEDIESERFKTWLKNLASQKPKELLRLLT